MHRVLALGTLLASGCTMAVEDRLSGKPESRDLGTGGTGGASVGATGGGGGTTTASTGGGATVGTGGMGGAGGTGMGEPSCPVVHDDFEDGVLDGMLWSTFGSSDVTLEETGGVLKLEMAGGGENRWGGVTSTSSYDLGTCGLTLHFAGSVTEGSMAYAYASFDSDNAAGFFVVGDRLYFAQEVDGNLDTNPTTFVPAQHAWWRLVVEQGDLVWKTSPDGMSWTEQDRRAPGFDTSSVYVVLGVGVLPSESTSGFAVSYDQVNWPPP